MHAKSANQKLLKKRPLFFSIGLVISLSLVGTAFEWKTNIIPIDLPDPGAGVIVEIPEIMATVHPIPPKPKPIIKTDNIEPKVEEKINEAIEEIEPDVVIEMTSAPVEFDPPALPAIVVDQAPFISVEEMPSFSGGYKAFYKYLGDNISYPKKAKHDNVEGKVYLSFIVDKDGSLTNIQVIKGISEECDLEAIRVLKASPKWNPGKQRDIPVRVQMVLPITFKLAN